MKFANIARGTAEERPTSYKLSLKGPEIAVVLRALDALEEADVEAEALAFAKARNTPTTPGAPVYESALMAATLARSILDPDSAAEKREPHFADVLEVLRLDTDTIAQLHEQQRIWQEEVSPNARKMTEAELMKLAKEIAESNDPKDYTRLSPRTRWTLQRTTGYLLAALRDFKPPSSSPESTSTATG